MTRISRKLSFFKRNHYFIFGFFWLLMAFFYLLDAEWGEDKSVFEFVMSGAYLLVSILYFYSAYKQSGEKGEYIEWDENLLIYKQNLGKIHSYKIESLTNLTVAKNNLIIKARNGQGTMAPLKGYSEEDLQLLWAEFGNFNTVMLS